MDPSQPVVGQVDLSTDYSTYLYRTGQTSGGLTTTGTGSPGQILGTNLTLGLGPVKPTPPYTPTQVTAVGMPAPTVVDFETPPAEAYGSPTTPSGQNDPLLPGVSPFAAAFPGGSSGGSASTTTTSGSPTGVLLASAPTTGGTPSTGSTPQTPVANAGPIQGPLTPFGPAQPVPEPSALVLAGLGAAGLWASRRRGCRAGRPE
jgi:hypothetical protein